VGLGLLGGRGVEEGVLELAVFSFPAAAFEDVGVFLDGVGVGFVEAIVDGGVDSTADEIRCTLGPKSQ
jgi:hypothetical protein